ncbi:MAG: tRNA pseudouridine(55) synthase TruB [Chloroflexi bacterium]|nr:tRNA pseudouridine(55) synthase TruB [Chloroflexota bacterium]|tara:strand:+ start:4249 stop:5130 length:882 start_codon:yes stop_codon:yes gene_type:complete
MNGWLLVDKPSGVSSHDVVQRARRIIPGCRIGHTGTLDPLATGLLVLGIGNTTRLSEYLISQPKRYTAVIRLGVTTTTFDADGDIMSEEDIKIGAAEIESILPNFIGSIEQVPPIYSAIKIGGERAYKLARSGKTVKMSPRSVRIDQLAMVDYCSPDVTLEISCSSGTYVRSLAHDLGESIGCGAHVLCLRRDVVGPFSLHQSYQLEDIEQTHDSSELSSLLLPSGDAMVGWQQVCLGEDDVRKIRHGNSVKVSGCVSENLALAYDVEGELIAVLEGQPELGYWQPRKVLMSK